MGVDIRRLRNLSPVRYQYLARASDIQVCVTSAGDNTACIAVALEFDFFNVVLISVFDLLF